MRKKKLVKTQTFTIEVKTYSDGSEVVNHSSTGFDRFKLIGILSTYRDLHLVGQIQDISNQLPHPDAQKTT